MKAGISNFGSARNTGNNFRGYDLILGGMPTDPAVRQLCLDRSPIYQAHHEAAPTLILHGDDDRCVPASQGHEMFVCLRSLGTEVQMATYPREGHQITEPDHVSDVWARTIRWVSLIGPPTHDRLPRPQDPAVAGRSRRGVADRLLAHARHPGRGSPGRPRRAGQRYCDAPTSTSVNGLSLPLWDQYWQLIDNYVHLRLGYSYRSNQPVATLIEQALPKTLVLVTLALLLALILAIPAGILQATRRNKLG